MIKEKKTKIGRKSHPKILLYASSLRNFRSSVIEYLYEISQVYPTVLLSEELDSETKKILSDKKIFPYLEEIFPVRQYGGEKIGLVKKHRYFCKLAKNIIKQYQPDIVIANGSNFFEAYLRRFARKLGVTNVCFMESIPGPKKQMMEEYILRIAYFKAPKFLPFFFKLLFAKARTYVGHFLYYVVGPMLILQKPFLGEPSSVLIADYSRFKGIDYFIVFSKRDHNILLNDGLWPEKIYIVNHPLKKESSLRRFFKKINFPKILRANKKTLIILWPPEQVGISRADRSLISKNEIWENRAKTVNSIANILKKWKIIIKPHPLAENFSEISGYFKPISNIEVKNPTDFAEKYIEISNVVVGLSPASSILFNSFLRNSKRPTLSLDFQQEFCGDAYKGFEGIEYIDSEEKLFKIIELIRDQKYQKSKKTKEEQVDFKNITELIKYLLNKKFLPKADSPRVGKTQSL
ncbi:MAG: hypothetical protein PHF44_02760 [Candidatus Pacebacteria bacterium]|nr:hypothetical protein [Candidatus Paceibacterota bacterium]